MKVLKFILRYMGITLSSMVYGMGISLFLNPHNLAPGGISGLAIIVHSTLPFDMGVGMLILIFNIPIMIAGVWKFGVRFILSTIYTLIISSIAIDIIPEITGIKWVTKDLMLSAVIGGAMLGLSMGIMFRLETTTGGADVIVKIIRQYKPYLKTGQIFLMIDALVVTISAIAFHNIEVALFSAIAIFVSSAVMNKTLYGADEATLIYIVSHKRKEIAGRMLEELNIGVTMIQAVGAYTGEETEMIMCVMRKQNLTKVRKLIKETDPKAFMMIRGFICIATGV